MAKEVQTQNEAQFPEILIHKSVEALLRVIREDYENNSPEDTLLYNIFGNSKIGNFDFFEQAVSLFTRKHAKNRRVISVSMGYSTEHLNTPTIHITLPNETPDPAPIGGNEGFEDDYSVDNNSGNQVGTFTFGSKFNYNLLITSDNTWEVILIYNVLKMGFMSIHEHFALMGFKNLNFGGNDLNFDDDLVPPNIFHRNFNMSFDFDTSVKGLIPLRFGTKFIISEITKVFSLDTTVEEAATTFTLNKPMIEVLSATGTSVMLRVTDTNDLTRSGFKIYRGLTPSNLVKIADLDAVTLEYEDTNVLEGVVYFYVVEVFITNPYEARRSGWATALPTNAFGSVSLNGGDIITDEVPVGGTYDIQVLDGADTPRGVVESAGLIRISVRLTNDFTVTLDADDLTKITLTATGDAAHEYLWRLDDGETLGSGQVLTTNIYKWKAWNITLITTDNASGGAGGVSKLNVNNFTVNTPILPFVFPNSGGLFAASTFRMFPDQLYCCTIYRLANSGFGTAGDTLEVGFDANGAADMDAVEAFEGDENNVRVSKIYNPLKGNVFNVQDLDESVEAYQFGLKRGYNGLPRFYAFSIVNAEQYDPEDGAVNLDSPTYRRTSIVIWGDDGISNKTWYMFATQPSRAAIAFIGGTMRDYSASAIISLKLSPGFYKTNSEPQLAMISRAPYGGLFTNEVYFYLDGYKEIVYGTGGIAANIDALLQQQNEGQGFYFMATSPISTHRINGIEETKYINNMEAYFNARFPDVAIPQNPYDVEPYGAFQLSLDSSVRYLLIPTNFTALGEFTIIFNVKRTQITTTINTILGSTVGSSPSVFWQESAGQDTLRVNLVSVSVDFVFPSGTFDVGVWRQVIITRQANEDLQVYVDGIESITGIIPNQDSGARIFNIIGSGSGGLQAEAMIAHLAMYQVATSPAEVAAFAALDYANGDVVTDVKPNPQKYYKFDESFPTTIAIDYGTDASDMDITTNGLNEYYWR